jgi:cytochrome c biogenesis protein CcmG/thiol:disulfide interchange protein DsbE
VVWRREATENVAPVIDQSGEADAPAVSSRLRRGVVALLRALSVAVVLGLLALLVWDLVRTTSGAKFTTLIKQGEKPPAPAFLLPVLWDQHQTWPAGLRSRLEDGRVGLSELRGYPVVVNFWASWCLPCRDEAPAFRAAAQRYAGRVAFIGIDNQDLKSAARRFLDRYRVNYVSVRDGSDHTYIAYGLTGVPETYFLDRRGRAVRHVVGAVSQLELEQDAQSLLKP